MPKQEDEEEEKKKIVDWYLQSRFHYAARLKT